MMPGSAGRGAWELSQTEPHDEFLELCAASTTGDLTDDERKRLQAHLAICSQCRAVMGQYQSIVSDVIPAVAADQSSGRVPEDATWSKQAKEKAERNLLERLTRGENDSHNTSKPRNSSSLFPHRILPFSSDSTWRNLWALYVAGILLFFALSLFAYRLAIHRSTAVSKTPPQQSTQQENVPARATLEEQLSDAGHDRAIANAEIAKRDKLIADLRSQMARQFVEINQLKEAQTQLETDLHADNPSRQQTSLEKAELEQKLESAENGSRRLQQKIDALAQQSSEDASRAKASDAMVSDLSRQLKDQQEAVAQRDEMLLHDRDIREVMGARELYIAEIYDVAGTGETKRPYGRIFYTRGKSLIFYAYDLDQQAELKLAGAFQAWGRRGPDRQQAINLGVFYEDNANKKRWILKCDDPQTLAQIDAVFVTVEPKGGSHQPSKKTLLFASLKIDPNHP